MRIRLKIGLLSLAIPFAVVGSYSAWETARLGEELVSDVIAANRGVLENSLPVIQNSLWFFDLAACDTIVEGLAKSQDVREVLLFGDNGALSAGVRRVGNGIEKISGARTLPDGYRQDGGPDLLVHRSKEDSRIEFMQRIRKDKDYLGTVVVRLGTEKIESRLAELQTRSLLAGAGLSVILFFVFMFSLQRSLIRPVLAIAGGVRSIAAGALSTRIRLHRNDEIGALADSIDAMAESIEAHARTLQELLTRGRGIASQVSLQGIAEGVADAGKFMFGIEIEAVFSADVCAQGERGFYGFRNGKLTPVALRHHIDVVDVRQGQVLGRLGFEADLTPEQESWLGVLATNVASAITTVLLERTYRRLDEKTAEIRGILASIPQGIVLVDGAMRIGPNHSAHARRILRCETLAGLSLDEVFFSRTRLSADVRSEIAEVIGCTVGEDELSFVVNESLLPREAVMADDESIVEIDWVPLAAPEGTIQNLLVTFRDVTEIRRLRQAEERRQREMDILRQVVSVAPEKFEKFIARANQYLGRTISILQCGHPLDHLELAEVKRNLHTLKGNSRAFQFGEIARLAHDAESVVVAYSEGKAVALSQNDIGVLIGRIADVVGEYRLVNNERLGRSGETEERRKAVLAQATKLAEVALQSERDVVRRSSLAGLFHMLLRLQYESLADLQPRLEANLTSLACGLGRQPPQLVIERGGEFVFNEEASESIFESLVHLTRNTLDHGFAAGECGIITLEAERRGDAIAVRYSANELGLDLERIAITAADKGLVVPDSDEELAALIFRSSFSTKGSVTELSGRGVGLDAVKNFMRVIGGDVVLEFTGPRQAGGRRPFVLTLLVPRSCSYDLAAADALRAAS